MVARIWRNWNPQTSSVGMYNGTAALQNNLAVLKWLKIATIWLSNSTPRYVAKKNENTCLHKNLYMKVHSSIINNSQSVETQMSTNWWMDKHNVVDLKLKYHPAMKRNICYKFNEPWKYYANLKKPVTKVHILYDSIHMEA